MSEESVAVDMVGRRFGSLADLPKELLGLLNMGKRDELEEQILRTIKDRYEGIASVDEVLVGLYRDYQYVPPDRKTVANKLYRMTKTNLLTSEPKKKGVYRISKSGS